MRSGSFSGRTRSEGEGGRSGPGGGSDMGTGARCGAGSSEVLEGVERNFGKSPVGATFGYSSEVSNNRH